MWKTPPSNARPELPRAGLASTRGCPGQLLGAASLGWPGGGGRERLAGQRGLAFHLARALVALGLEGREGVVTLRPANVLPEHLVEREKKLRLRFGLGLGLGLGPGLEPGLG